MRQVKRTDRPQIDRQPCGFPKRLFVVAINLCFMQLLDDGATES